MAYRNLILWRFSGYADQKSAEDGLDNQLGWFRKTFNPDEWTVASSVNQTAFGWSAEIKAEKDSG